MSNLYLDPNGKSITFREWKKRIPAEYKIYEHRTAKTITKLMAADIVMDANLIPEEKHKRYRMESINILTHDAMGEEYDEPKYVEDDFARKTFTTKAKAVKEFVEFCAKWCGADEAAMTAELEKDVEVTKVPAIDLSPKHMSLPALGKVSAPLPSDDDDDDDSSGDEDDSDGDDDDDAPAKPKKSKKAPKAEPKAPAGSDAPMTSITDDIGSW